MSKTVAQIYAINPTTVVADTDLYYLVQSPYAPGDDAAILGSDLKLAFGAGGTISPGIANQIAYYATTGSTISGLTGGNNGTLITSPTGVPSISSTLPSAVQTNITALGAQSQALNMNSNQINNLTAGVAATDAVNVGQLASVASPLTTKGDLFTFTTINARLPVGTINGQILQVNSIAATGLAWSTATYPATATNAARILRSDGTNWVETTATFADIYSASSLLFSNIANNITGLPTANNGALVTSNTGVPSILAGPGTTGNFLQSNAASAPSWSASTITLGGNFTMSGAFTFTGTITGNTAVTFPVSGTLATTAQIPTLPLSLANGGTNANLTASNGGIFYSTATAGAILAGTATAGQMLQSGATSAPTWSTTTYPATNAINTLLYASSANVMAALATSNDSFLTTSSGGVPTWNANLPFNQVNIVQFVASGTYTPTTGMKYCIIEALGQGGGGGGTASSTGGSGGGGGGSGSYSRAFASAATIGVNQTVTIANTGGAGGAAGNNAGTAGSDASLGAICIGKGGSGGAGSPANTLGSGGNGGVAGTGTVTAVGNRGGNGTGASITTFTIIGGMGAPSYLGGSPGLQSGAGVGLAATNYGAGGNGGRSQSSSAAAAGGNGSGGIIIITEFIFA